MANKPCRQPRCPNFEPCAEHKPEPWAGSTRRATLPPDWRKRRRRTLDRDVYCTCSGCKECTSGGCERRSTEADHIGHRDDHDRLAGKCSRCHRVRTLEQAAEAKRLG